MNARWARTVGYGVFSTALLVSLGCNNSNDPTNPPAGGGASALTVSNSVPTGGDGDVTAMGTLTVDSGGTGLDELNLSETGHDVTILWDTNTHALHSVSHGWGAGYAQCVEGTATACDPAKVAIDFAGHKVTITALDLTDDPLGGGSTCTLDGDARW